MTALEYLATLGDIKHVHVERVKGWFADLGASVTMTFVFVVTGPWADPSRERQLLVGEHTDEVTHVTRAYTCKLPESRAERAQLLAEPLLLLSLPRVPVQP